jgi:hypothetical protein
MFGLVDVVLVGQHRQTQQVEEKDREHDLTIEEIH